MAGAFKFDSQQFILPFVQRCPADSMFRSNFFSRGFSNAKIDYNLFFLILLYFYHRGPRTTRMRRPADIFF